MLVVLVYVHVKPEFIESFASVSMENARCSVKEPGIAGFDVIRQNDDRCRFILVEAYRDPEAPARHKETPHYLKWREAVEPMMAEPRRSVKYENIYPDDRGWR